MKIIFVRHGETKWNIERRFQGQTNKSRLTENGIHQAEQVANKLKDYDYDVVISSPLDRAIETAKKINIYHNKQIQTDNRLLERGYGDLEGISSDNTKYTIGELWDYDRNIGEDKIEQLQIFFKRVYNFFDELINENKHQKVLVVSHSGVAIALKTYFEGMPQNKDLLSLSIENCGILEYDIDKRYL